MKKANAKLLLFGEHSVLYGYPAIGLSLPWTTEVIESLPTNGEKSLGKERVFTSQKEMQELRKRLESSSVWRDPLWQSLVSPTKVSSSWQIASTVPRVGGFGSSATLCVALARFFLEEINQERGVIINYFANELERLFHRTPSGVDTSLASAKGLFLLNPKIATAESSDSKQRLNPSLDPIEQVGEIAHFSTPTREKIRLKESLFFVLAQLPREQNCSDLIEKVHGEVKRGSGESIERLGALTLDAEKLLRHKKIPLGMLASLITKAQEELDRLGLGSPLFNQLEQLAQKEGSLAGKLSGAGSGGAAFFLCRDREHTKRVVGRLNEEVSNLSIPPLIPIQVTSKGAQFIS